MLLTLYTSFVACFWAISMSSISLLYHGLHITFPYSRCGRISVLYILLNDLLVICKNERLINPVTLFPLFIQSLMCLPNFKSRKENPQKLTQLSSRSHPRHLVGKRTAQKDTTGLEIYTRPLVFMSSLSVRTSEICYWLAVSDE